MSKKLTYLALGDSYTIGEAVEQQASFPYLLASELEKHQYETAQPLVIAKTGWTTDELAAAIEEAGVDQTFDIVTLLIGVNNQYRGYPTDIYEKEFTSLLEKAIGFANNKRNRVFVLSIPDWGLTPFATENNRDAKLVAQEIDLFNSINKKISLAHQVHYTDITPISREAAEEPKLIAEDGLHPSGLMYQKWVELLKTQVVEALK